ncbi:hypothetical protein FOVG_19851 [Fusarium oxysporum f. sp. pisi HDV247]|uniref:Uncharacterized protein n=1 Tax=Fusarium oxysporum f. sp. pisi HDV247 TaxID=1080344 RepID=W9NCW1_FUSOX|nr:hypothetical protein FOVG_19851 [Fusarium oxysporum f. sp. pisi HDV247]
MWTTVCLTTGVRYPAVTVVKEPAYTASRTMIVLTRTEVLMRL